MLFICNDCDRITDEQDMAYNSKMEILKCPWCYSDDIEEYTEGESEDTESEE